MVDEIGRAASPDLRLEQEEPVPRPAEPDLGMHHIAPLPLPPVHDLLSDPVRLASHLGALKGEDLRLELCRINHASNLSADLDQNPLSKLPFKHLEELHQVFQQQASSRLNPMSYLRMLLLDCAVFLS